MNAPEVYARLLLEQGVPAEAMEQVRALAGEAELTAALENPAYDRRDKEAVVNRLFPAEARRFFRLLCGHGDYALLPAILEEYDALVRRRDGVARVVFTCCHPPTEEQRRKLEDLVCRKYGKTAVDWHTVLDPAILGGFILTVDDWILDQSLRAMVQDLGRRLKGGSAP